MLKEIISFIPSDRSINVVDATFGGGGYSRAILKHFSVKELIAIDRDPISKIFSKDINHKYQNFTLINDKFSKIEAVIRKSKLKEKKFDIIIYDLGTSSNQIDNPDRGFSFNNEGPLDMRMGLNEKNAFEIINKLDEKNLAKIIYEFGEERYSRVIAKEIVKNRKIKFISNTSQLSQIIKTCLPKNNSRKKNYSSCN